MKKCFFCLMVLTALLLALTVGYAENSGSCGDNVTWSLSDDGTLTISGTGAMTDYAVGESPWFDYRRSIKSIVIESGVTNIGDYVFHGCQNEALQSVTIPDSVTRIGKSAFLACSNLPVITVPDSVTEIGESAFDSCYKLTSINIPDRVMIIPTKAFFNCASLTSVNIPDGVTSIGDEAFSACNSLTEVNIPDKVTSIGTGAFSNCSSLTEITISASVVSFGSDPFYDCDKLTKIILQGGKDQYDQVGSSLPENVDIVIAGGSCGTDVTYELTIAGKLTISGTGATADSDSPWYNSMRSIKSIVIEEGVTGIGDEAFCIAVNVETVTFPSTLTKIGNNAFGGCRSLASIEIPAKVKTIGNNAFDSCEKLTSITFAKDENGRSALSRIGVQAFSTCTSLTSISLPEGVTTIEACAFAGCSELACVSIPASVTSIESDAFYSFYYNLEKVYYTGSNPDMLTNGTGIDPTQTKLLIADGTCGENVSWELSVYGVMTISGSGMMADYSEGQPAPWSENTINSLEIGSGVETIGDYAFFGAQSLAQVSIPESVTQIGEHALGYITDTQKVENFTIKGSLLTAAVGYAMKNGFRFTPVEDITGMNKLVLPSDLKKIMDGSFSGTAAELIEIPSGCEYIAQDAFENCANLKVILNHSDQTVTVSGNVLVMKPE